VTLLFIIILGASLFSYTEDFDGMSVPAQVTTIALYILVLILVAMRSIS
jgi:hypothetical protein